MFNLRDANSKRNANFLEQFSDELRQGSELGYRYGNVETYRDKLGENIGRDITGARPGYYGRSALELINPKTRDDLAGQLGAEYKKDGVKWNDLTLGQQLGIIGGSIGGDTVSYGTRHYLWNVFPPDLVGTYAANEFTDRGYDKNWRNLGRVGTVEALNLLSANYALGNLAQGGRPEGFKAISPEEDDLTESTNPVYDFVINRGLLGRRGSLLPWEDFQKERPDVSYQEYKDYKDYLYNEEDGILSTASLGLVKGTWDGINNVPELSIMGFTIQPQGVLGAVGAGAAIGLAHDEIAKSNPEMELSVKENKFKNELYNDLPHATGLDPDFIRDMVNDRFTDGRERRVDHVEKELTKRYRPETAMSLKSRSTIIPSMSDLEFISKRTEELGKQKQKMIKKRKELDQQRIDKQKRENIFRLAKDVKGRKILGIPF